MPQEKNVNLQGDLKLIFIWSLKIWCILCCRKNMTVKIIHTQQICHHERKTVRTTRFLCISVLLCWGEGPKKQKYYGTKLSPNFQHFMTFSQRLENSIISKCNSFSFLHILKNMLCVENYQKYFFKRHERQISKNLTLELLTFL